MYCSVCYLRFLNNNPDSYCLLGCAALLKKYKPVREHSDFSRLWYTVDEPEDAPRASSSEATGMQRAEGMQLSQRASWAMPPRARRVARLVAV
jgi:hypothetical protein